MPNTEEYIGVVISDVARLLRTEFDRRVRRLGITRGQWLVLTRLHRRPGASHSELAEMMEVEKATAGRMIDRLVANGWVERRAQPGDRRVKRVYLTPKPNGCTSASGGSLRTRLKPRLPICPPGRASSCSHCCSASRRRWFPAPTVRQEVRRLSPGGIRFRAGRAASTAGSRRDAAPTKTGADRRACARHCRCACLLAAGRPPRHHRKRLRQG